MIIIGLFDLSINLTSSIIKPIILKSKEVAMSKIRTAKDIQKDWDSNRGGKMLNETILLMK